MGISLYELGAGLLQITRFKLEIELKFNLGTFFWVRFGNHQLVVGPKSEKIRLRNCYAGKCKHGKPLLKKCNCIAMNHIKNEDRSAV